MAIPVIPGTAAVQSPQLGVRRNVAAEEAPYTAEQRAIGAGAQAFDAAAQGVTTAVGAIADYEHRKQEAAEVDVTNRAFIAMNTLTQAQRVELAHANTRDAIDQIVPNWQKKATAAQDEFLNDPRLNPTAKIRLRQQFDKLNGHTTAEFQVAADIKTTQLQHATMKEAVADALRTGDPEMIRNATAIVDHAQGAGIISPEEATHEKSRFPEVLAKNQILNGIDHDPVATRELLLKDGTFPEIKDPNLRRILLREAGEMASRLQSKNLDDVINQITEAPIGSMPDDASIDLLVQSKAISAAGAVRAKNLVKVRTGQAKRAELDDAKDQAAQLKLAVFEMDFNTEKNPEESAAKLNEEIAGLPSLAMQIPIRQELQRKLDAFHKKQVVENHPVETETYRLMKDSFQTGFSTTRSEAEWRKESTPESRRAAEDYYHQILPKMQAWFEDKKANKEPITYEEADKYRRSLTEPYVNEQVKSALLGTSLLSTRVTVQDKAGKRFTVPASQLEQAKAQGYTEVR